MKRGLWLWVALLVLAAVERAELANVQTPPLITAYTPSGCVPKGSQLRMNGMNFSDAQGDRRIVLWSGGVGVEALVLTWRDTDVLIRIPDDARIREGERYELRVVRQLGDITGTAGPPIQICATTATRKATPAPVLSVDQAAAAQARQLVSQVMRASGAGHWRDVKRLAFTFHVAQAGKDIVSAHHDWDLRGGTDKVTWGDKTATVNLRQPAADADSQAAYKRWVNDSYWLLMPLKLSDPGVRVTSTGRTVVAGKPYETLRLSFEPVGMTPHDQYAIYVDPATSLVAYWDYLPDDTRKVSGTLEKYQDFGGLQLSTEHQFGDKHVWFTDVKVEK